MVVSGTNICVRIVDTADFRRFSLSTGSFKTAPKGKGDLHGPLAALLILADRARST
jgi:hypothetical protein